MATGDPQVQELIAAYHAAEKGRGRARRVVSLLVLGVILAYVAVIIATINDFRTRRMPEFAAALGNEAASLMPGLTRDLQGMMNRLYPHYVNTFQQMFERDWPEIEKAGRAELATLDQYAQSKWPKLEQGVNDLLTTTEEVTREELNQFLTPEETEQILNAYGEALDKQVKHLMERRMKDHASAAESIGKTLADMACTEPDLANRQIPLHEASGMLMELAGIEMQKGLQ